MRYTLWAKFSSTARAVTLVRLRLSTPISKFRMSWRFTSPEGLRGHRRGELVADGAARPFVHDVAGDGGDVRLVQERQLVSQAKSPMSNPAKSPMSNHSKSPS